SGKPERRFRRRLSPGCSDPLFPAARHHNQIHWTGLAIHTDSNAARDGIAQGCRVAPVGPYPLWSPWVVHTTKEYGMRRKLIALTSAAAAVALMASACSSSKSSGSSSGSGSGTTAAPSSNQLGTGGTGSTGSAITTDGKGKTVNIWLMQDAQKG